MSNIDEVLKEFPVISLKVGECLIREGEQKNALYFLSDGAVEVIKDGYKVAESSGQGSVFGEMSMLLGIKHSATVQCTKDSKFYHIDNPKSYLNSHPEMIWQIALMLSRRIYDLNLYFVDEKNHHEHPIKIDSDELQDENYRKIMAKQALSILQVQHFD